MNIYLDIDGVLLNHGAKAEGADEFLEFVTRNFEAFWLTTHCKGNADVPFRLLRDRGFDINWILRIKPTNWDVLKTDAIDFSKPFLWLEDSPLASEQAALIAAGKEDCLVLVDLNKKPGMLREIMNDLRAGL